MPTKPRKPGQSTKAAKAARVYTAPHRPKLRWRPAWHRMIGVLLLTLGITTILVNLVAEFTDAPLLPGGHSPLYLLTGMAVAGYSTWWFGWFDRPR